MKLMHVSSWNEVLMPTTECVGQPVNSSSVEISSACFSTWDRSAGGDGGTCQTGRLGYLAWSGPGLPSLTLSHTRLASSDGRDNGITAALQYHLDGISTV